MDSLSGATITPEWKTHGAWSKRRANKARRNVKFRRSDQRWAIRSEIRTFGNEFPLVSDTQQLRDIISQVQGVISCIDEMNACGAASLAVMMLVLIWRVILV